MTPSRIFPIPAAINHLLGTEPWARRRLAPHAGKVACIDAGLATVALLVTADGLLQAAPADAVAAVTIRIQAADLPLIAQHRERAFSYVKVEGDAEFANVISLLSQNLRWEAEDDLARLVGDIAAARIVGGARDILERASSGSRKLAENVAEYLVEEQPMLMRPLVVREFADQVTTLRERSGAPVQAHRQAGKRPQKRRLEMILKFLRVLKILRVAVRYGLDEIAISNLAIPRTAKLIDTLFFWRDLSAPRAVRLRLALEELGPIFVKFGQVLSTRRDLMPPDIADELAKLQDQVPPFPSQLALAELEKALRQPGERGVRRVRP